MSHVAGIVLAASGGTVLLLTEEGQLVACPAPDPPPAVGEVIVVPQALLDQPSRLIPGPSPATGQPLTRPRAAQARWRRMGWRHWLGVAAVAAALVAVLVGGWYGRVLAPPPPVALVALDINPSVELLLNRTSAVVAVRALNPDGQRILAGADLIGKPAPDATAALVDRAAAMGYLAASGSPVIVVALVPLTDPALLPVTQEQLASAVATSAAAAPVEPAIVVQVLDRHMAEAARQQDLSVNVLAAAQAAAQHGRSVEPEALRRQGIRAVLQATGLTPAQLFAALPGPTGDNRLPTPLILAPSSLRPAPGPEPGAPQPAVPDLAGPSPPPAQGTRPAPVAPVDAAGGPPPATAAPVQGGRPARDQGTAPLPPRAVSGGPGRERPSGGTAAQPGPARDGRGQGNGVEAQNASRLVGGQGQQPPVPVAQPPGGGNGRPSGQGAGARSGQQGPEQQGHQATGQQGHQGTQQQGEEKEPAREQERKSPLPQDDYEDGNGGEDGEHVGD